MSNNVNYMPVLLKLMSSKY